MSDFDLRVLLAVSIGYAPILALLAWPLFRPSVLPPGTLNSHGNFCFVDIGAAGAAFFFFAVFFVGKVLMSTRIDAAELGAAVIFAALLAMAAGVYAHIIWRRAVRPLP